ncbi:MAG TPA: hypothetical protein VHF07_01610 [Nitrospiraceae bacterium]|nr:hypothetical protein [Nitrospiraceae bacterium]
MARAACGDRRLIGTGHEAHPGCRRVRCAVFLSLVFWVLPDAVSSAASKVSAILIVKDALTVPNRPATIEARLLQPGLMSDTGLGGESLQMEIGGHTVATAMTGGDGRAYFEYTPKARGNVVFGVALPSSPRVDAPRASGLLAVWEHRKPILLVEAMALIDRQAESPIPSVPFGKPAVPPLKPAADAADELTRLAQFYYNVIYVAPPDEGPFSAAASNEFRQWLADNRFPTGLILHKQISPAGLGTMLDDLKHDGWTSLKSGIGRTPAFAALLVERRMEAVLVPEPAKGEVPRKVKTAKDWKDVRKKL